MAENPGALQWVGGLSCAAIIVGCSVSTDSPPAQPSSAGSLARNVILFIGDGMGVSTVTAARIFDGQSQGMNGEEHSLVFETFPHVALVKTYNTNQQVPDSAGTATAMMTGEKTRAGVINIGPNAHRRDCREALDHPFVPLGGRAEFYGGQFDDNRLAGQDDLIQDWLDADTGRAYVTTRDELTRVQPGQQVLGIFSRSHMTYVAERDPETTEPTLAQMTAAAIDQLAGAEDGFFLMVEGSRIDHGHHDGKPGYPVRGNPILGLVVENDVTGEPAPAAAVDVNGTPYTTLGYANGPGAAAGQPRAAPDVGSRIVYQSLVPVVHPRIDGSLDYGETHGGEDVALYGIGAGSDRVGGVIEQNVVFDIMTQAFGRDQED